MTFEYEVNVNETGFCVLVFYDEKMYCVTSSDKQKYMPVSEHMQYNDRWGIFYSHFVTEGRFNDESRSISQVEFDQYTHEEALNGVCVNCCNGNVWEIVQKIYNHVKLPEHLDCVCFDAATLMTPRKAAGKRKMYTKPLEIPATITRKKRQQEITIFSNTKRRSIVF